MKQRIESLFFGTMTAWASLLLVLALTAGCSTLSQTVEDHPIAAQLAVQVATAEIIDGDEERRGRVLELVATARQLTGTATSVELIADAVHEAVRWDRLDPDERFLAEALLARVQLELEERIGEGLLDPDDRVAVMAVLGWIESAAQRS